MTETHKAVQALANIIHQPNGGGKSFSPDFPDSPEQRFSAILASLRGDPKAVQVLQSVRQSVAVAPRAQRWVPIIDHAIANLQHPQDDAPREASNTQPAQDRHYTAPQTSGNDQVDDSGRTHDDHNRLPLEHKVNSDQDKLPPQAKPASPPAQNDDVPDTAKNDAGVPTQNNEKPQPRQATGDENPQPRQEVSGNKEQEPPVAPVHKGNAQTKTLDTVGTPGTPAVVVSPQGPPSKQDLPQANTENVLENVPAKAQTLTPGEQRQQIILINNEGKSQTLPPEQQQNNQQPINPNLGNQKKGGGQASPTVTLASSGVTTHVSLPHGEDVGAPQPGRTNPPPFQIKAVVTGEPATNRLDIDVGKVTPNQPEPHGSGTSGWLRVSNDLFQEIRSTSTLSLVRFIDQNFGEGTAAKSQLQVDVLNPHNQPRPPQLPTVLGSGTIKAVLETLSETPSEVTPQVSGNSLPKPAASSLATAQVEQPTIKSSQASVPTVTVSTAPTPPPTVSATSVNQNPNQVQGLQANSGAAYQASPNRPAFQGGSQTGSQSREQFTPHVGGVVPREKPKSTGEARPNSVFAEVATAALGKGQPVARQQAPRVVTPQQLHQIITKGASQAKNGGEQVIKVQLRPAELGSVSVRFEFAKDQKVKILVLVESKEAMEALGRERQQILQSLKESGFEHEGNQLEFSLNQDQAQQRAERETETETSAPRQEPESPVLEQSTPRPQNNIIEDDMVNVIV